MAGRLTAVEREEKAARAVALSAGGKTYTEIAEEVGCDRKTAKRWIADEIAGRAEHRGQDKEKAIAVYSEIIRAAWERFEKLDSRSLNVSGLLNTIKAAQERIDKITGAEAPSKVQHLDEDEWEVVWDDIDPAESFVEDGG